MLVCPLLGSFPTSLTSSALANGFSSAGLEGRDVIAISELNDRSKNERNEREVIFRPHMLLTDDTGKIITTFLS